jgi:ABC-type polar amino acid transport system ATPase subunit
MIIGKNISLQYKQKRGGVAFALKDVSFELKPGRITTFMGQSGAGKTTLLKCIANLHADYEGQITFNGKDLKSLIPAERASTIGFVLQQFHLFPHLSVLHNCTYALTQAIGMSKHDAEERASELLGLLGMQAFIHSAPSQLSGGQQQRVAIARALSLHPEVLLLDEPTSALDPDSKKSLETLLLDLNARGITIALSSHDMPFIKKIMDDVYFMENGCIIEEWDRKADNQPSTSKIQLFLASD